MVVFAIARKILRHSAPPVDPSAFDHSPRGAYKDLEVQHRGPVIDIPDVEFDPLLPGERVAPVDLCPSREAGFDLQTAALAAGVLIHLRDRSPREPPQPLAAN